MPCAAGAHTRFQRWGTLSRALRPQRDAAAPGCGTDPSPSPQPGAVSGTGRPRTLLLPASQRGGSGRPSDAAEPGERVWAPPCLAQLAEGDVAASPPGRRCRSSGAAAAAVRGGRRGGIGKVRAVAAASQGKGPGCAHVHTLPEGRTRGTPPPRAAVEAFLLPRPGCSVPAWAPLTRPRPVPRSCIRAREPDWGWRLPWVLLA